MSYKDIKQEIQEDTDAIEQAQRDTEELVLTTLSLLAATEVPKAAYENIEGGEEAWQRCIEKGLIECVEGFWIVTSDGDATIERQPTWTEDMEKRFISTVNSRMQGCYSSALGESTRAYDISDKIGAGMAYAIGQALQDVGLRPKNN